MQFATIIVTQQYLGNGSVQRNVQPLSTTSNLKHELKICYVVKQLELSGDRFRIYRISVMTVQLLMSDLYCRQMLHRCISCLTQNAPEMLA